MSMRVADRFRCCTIGGKQSDRFDSAASNAARRNSNLLFDVPSAMYRGIRTRVEPAPKMSIRLDHTCIFSGRGIAEIKKSRSHARARQVLTKLINGGANLMNKPHS